MEAAKAFVILSSNDGSSTEDAATTDNGGSGAAQMVQDTSFPIVKLVSSLLFTPEAVSRLLGTLELNGIEIIIDTPGALACRLVSSGTRQSASLEAG